MKKLFSLLIISILACANIFAQEETPRELIFNDFYPEENGAPVSGPEDDCGLVKVILPLKGATIEGSKVLAVEPSDKGYDVYLSAGATYFTISAKKFPQLRVDFAPISAKESYIAEVEAQGADDNSRFTIDLPRVEVGGRLVKEAVSFDMLLVEKGRFRIGATKEQENPSKDELNTPWVTISKDFYMGETEVTQELWEYVMGTNPSQSKGTKKPVENITWAEAREFAKQLSVITGLNFNLPTEAQWEFAARGGMKTDRYQYSGSHDINEVAWYADNSRNDTYDVKSLKPNELGLYDMSGNVWELCLDFKHGEDKYPDGPLVDYINIDKSAQKVRRGGAWDEPFTKCRVAYRRRMPLDKADKSTGLRLVLTIN